MYPFLKKYARHSSVGLVEYGVYVHYRNYSDNFDRIAYLASEATLHDLNRLIVAFYVCNALVTTNVNKHANH